MTFRNNYKHLLEKTGGLLEVETKIPINDSFALSLVYTPGVGKCCLDIEKDINKSFELTNRGNSVAVIFIESDKNKHIEANLPRLELKVLLYKDIAKVDAYPLLVKNDDINKLLTTIKSIEPSFSCIEIIADKEITDLLEKELDKTNKIPVLYSYQSEEIAKTVKECSGFENNDQEIINAALIKALINLKPQNYKYTDNNQIKEYCQNVLNGEIKPNNLLLSHSLKLFSAFYEYFLHKITENFKSEPTQKINKLTAEYEDSLFLKPNALFKQTNKNYKIEKHSIEENSIELHKRAKGVITVAPKVDLNMSENYKTLLSADFTENIASEINTFPEKVYDYTSKNNLVLIISDGSAVLGFGNIGAEASIPVLEGKSALLKKLGGVNALPIALNTQNPNEIVDIVCSLSPSFGGIHLEDISAPRCFEIENRIMEKLDMPVFHDDQHGTAIIVLAGVINALKVAGKDIKDIKIVMTGAGAAALSVAELLIHNGARNITLNDIYGPVYKGRAKGMNPYLDAIAEKTNPDNLKGSLKEVIRGADLFIGLSAANILTAEMVKSMNNRSCVFALANPTPEIMPEIAKEAGAYIVATGRSDFHNQINNSLAFPGVFRGALDVRAKCINKEMKSNAAKAIASLIPDEKLRPDLIIPNALDLRVAPAVAKAIAESAIKTKVASVIKEPDDIYEKLKNYYFEGSLRKI
ncbi:MAG: malic enzyme-like NAD(P)-binding protein [bacterium]